jgi:UDP-GlcNAc:undecaprenyl-phosphate/decaprenyl-phosphate GlcNAc-1-phosphate transferase
LLYIFPIVAFALTALALWAGRHIALRFGFADKPGGRKQHHAPVPPIGGLAILPVFVAVSWLAGMDTIVPWPLAAGIASLLLMGAIDDARTVPPMIKFTIMVWTACFVVIFGEAQIADVGNLFGMGTVKLEIMSKPFTIMCLVLLMNSLNMMDGVDGLAGGFCALVVLAMLAVLAPGGAYFLTLTILLGALAGFLLFNMRAPWRKSASIFLGDAGSLCLGLLIGWFAIRLTQRGAAAPLQPATVIWIIALPVMDAFALFIARSVRGLHPFHADRTHLHHRLQDAGLSPGKTTAIMLGIILVMALTGFTAQYFHVPPVIMFVLWMILFIIHTKGLMHKRADVLFSQKSKL